MVKNGLHCDRYIEIERDRARNIIRIFILKIVFISWS